MSFYLDAKNAISLIFKGEWREFAIRWRVYLGHVDLKQVYLEELHLPEDRCYYYANSGGLHLEKVLKALKITPGDAIIDFGCGKGGVLITLAKYPFAKITGIELSPKLVAIAKQNLSRLKIKNVSIALSDAADFTDLDDYNFFYFFNPFPCNVMGAVMANISISLAKKPRKATIIYFNPECHETVIHGSLFVKTDEFRHHDLSYYIYTNGA